MQRKTQLLTLTQKEIKDVLQRCINAVADIKDQITNLVLFFGAFSTMVTNVIVHFTEDFLTQAKVVQDVVDEIGAISLDDLIRQCLATVTLMCLAYFSLFNTITNKYKTFSIEHIMPGVSLCEQMGKTTNDELHSVEARLLKLQTYMENARKSMEVDAKQVRKP